MRIREGQEKLSLIIKTSFKKKKKNTRIEVGCAREVLELKEQRCDNDLGLGSSEYRKTVITVLTVIEWIFHWCYSPRWWRREKGEGEVMIGSEEEEGEKKTKVGPFCLPFQASQTNWDSWERGYSVGPPSLSLSSPNFHPPHPVHLEGQLRLYTTRFFHYFYYYCSRSIIFIYLFNYLRLLFIF